MRNVLELNEEASLDRPAWTGDRSLRKNEGAVRSDITKC